MILQNGDLGYYMGVYIFFMFLIMAINIGIIVWVYRDAQNRGMEATLWLLVVLVGGCVGCIVYLIISKDYPSRESADWYKKNMRESGQPPDREFGRPQRPM